MQELWQPVKGYEGLYEVSDQGRVRSLDREVVRPAGGKFVKPVRRMIKGTILKPSVSPRCSYLQVPLNKLGKRKLCTVHRLAAAAFMGTHPQMEVNHIDGDKTNNAVSNLEWSNRKSNFEHAISSHLLSRNLAGQFTAAKCPNPSRLNRC